MAEIGKGVSYSVDEEGLLSIEIDTSNDYGYENWVKQGIKFYSDKNDLVILISSSGKSTIIASSSGNKQIELPNGQVAYLGLNLYIK